MENCVINNEIQWASQYRNYFKGNSHIIKDDSSSEMLLSGFDIFLQRAENTKQCDFNNFMGLYEFFLRNFEVTLRDYVHYKWDGDDEKASATAYLWHLRSIDNYNEISSQGEAD